MFNIKSQHYIQNTTSLKRCHGRLLQNYGLSRDQRKEVFKVISNLVIENSRQLYSMGSSGKCYTDTSSDTQTDTEVSTGSQNTEFTELFNRTKVNNSRIEADLVQSTNTESTETVNTTTPPFTTPLPDSSTTVESDPHLSFLKEKDAEKTEKMYSKYGIKNSHEVIRGKVKELLSETYITKTEFGPYKSSRKNYVVKRHNRPVIFDRSGKFGFVQRTGTIKKYHEKSKENRIKDINTCLNDRTISSVVGFDYIASEMKLAQIPPSLYKHKLSNEPYDYNKYYKVSKSAQTEKPVDYLSATGVITSLNNFANSLDDWKKTGLRAQFYLDECKMKNGKEMKRNDILFEFISKGEDLSIKNANKIFVNLEENYDISRDYIRKGGKIAAP